MNRKRLIRKIVYLISVIIGIWIAVCCIITREYASAITFGAIFILIPIIRVYKEADAKYGLSDKIRKNIWWQVFFYTVQSLSVLCFLSGYIVGGVWNDYFDSVLFKVCVVYLFGSVPLWIVSYFWGVGFFRARMRKDKPQVYIERKDCVRIPLAFVKHSDCILTENKIQLMFVVDSVKEEYVALDKRNGKPYYVHSPDSGISGELYSYEISYEEVKRLALKVGLGAKFDNLGIDNWTDFVSEDNKEDDEPKFRIQIKNTNFKEVSNPLMEFFCKYENKDGHLVVFFRKTTAGYRVFTASLCQGFDALPFNLTQIIHNTNEIIFKIVYECNYDAYDRLLSEQEVLYLQHQAKTLKGIRNSPNIITCYQWWEKRREEQKSKKWEEFADILKNMAIYGSDCSVESDGK